MLYYAVVFFVLALAAGVFGVGFVSSAFAGAAQILFVAFLVFFVISLISNATRKATS